MAGHGKWLVERGSKHWDWLGPAFMFCNVAGKAGAAAPRGAHAGCQSSLPVLNKSTSELISPLASVRHLPVQPPAAGAQPR